MKKLLLFNCIAAFSFAGFAQTGKLNQLKPVTNHALVNSSEILGDTPFKPSELEKAGGSGNSTSAAGDIIWSEDFGNGIPSGWSISGANSAQCPWVHSFDGSYGFFNGTPGGNAIQSTTASNGFLICDPDSANNALYGQPSGSQYQYLESYITSSAINMTGQPVARLEFQQAFRYNNSPVLEVGVSTDGVNFTTFDTKGNIAPNTASANPSTFSIDISSIAGNQPTVYLRFGWSARVYYWMIDDIKIVVPQNNDLKLAETYFYSYADSTATNYYTEIPQKHAALDTLIFGAAAGNAGSAVQLNTTLTATVTGAASFSSTSTPINVNPGATDSINVASDFIANQIGTYTVNFSIASDSVDFLPADNSVSKTFKVSEYTYARDIDNYTGGGSWWGPQVPYSIGNYFYAHTADTIRSIMALFQGQTSVGSIVSAHLYDGNLDNPLVSNTFHSLASNEIGTWVAFYLGDFPVTAGDLIPAIENISGNDSLIIGTSAGAPTTPPVTSFVDVNVDGTWGYISFTPMIRLVSKSPSLCATPINIAGTTQETGTGSITLGNPTGGMPIFSYSWSGPNGFSSNSKNISGISQQGTYTVTVTDGLGCQGTKAFTLAGNISTADVELAQNVKVFPNPSNGIVNVEINSTEKSAFTISVLNMLGQQVYSENVAVYGNMVKSVDLSNLAKGSYIVKIGSGMSAHTERVIIK